MTSNNNIQELTRIINRPICESVEVNDVIDIFSIISNRNTERTAIFDGTKSYSYGKLTEDADKLSLALKENGIKEGDIVAVVIGRSYNYFVSILAAMKCGAAFLPIDPAIPTERISFYCKDSFASLILEDLHGTTDYVENIPVLNVTNCLTSKISASFPEINYNPDSIAYIIYTSGSTGRPKGVKISRKALANFISGAVSLYQFSEKDRILQFSNLAFDASIEEIFGAFCSGASLFLRTPEMLLASELVKFTETHLITVWDLPTAFWRQIIQSDSYQLNAVLSSLRLVVIGGEAVTANDVLIWNKKPAKHRLYNTYGPTETTVVAMAFEIKSGYVPERSVPIGQPLPGYKLYISNPDRTAINQSDTGELLVGGESLALGYLNREAEQNKVFIQLDTPDDGIQRCYCTGDQVSVNKDGMLLYQGRVDRQVKIRGYRVEIGEIESSIQLYEGIRDTVVHLREDHDGDKRLVAYLVTNNESRIDNQKLRRFLKQRLPEYMVPSAYVLIDQIPLTLNGKIDFKSLPAPENVIEHPAKLNNQPITEVEKMLASIWSEILKIDKISLDDNFFESGGHSLFATILITKISEKLGVRLPLSLIFEKQTLSELSKEIKNGTNFHNAAEAILTIPHVETNSNIFPLSAGQKRLWFVENFEPGNLAYNIPLDYSIKGEIDLTILEKSIIELIRRHSTLRTILPTTNGEPFQQVLPELPFHLKVIDLSNLPHSERTKKAEKLSHENEIHLFDLAKGPLFCFKLLKISSDEYMLLMNFHHSITDGWSLKFLLEELGIIYTSIKRGKPFILSSIPITYADYSVWQNDWLRSKKLSKSSRILEK